MTRVTIRFTASSRINDIEGWTLHKYILPSNDTDPYYFWWSETVFSFYPNRVVEALRLTEEVEENGTVQKTALPDVSS